MKGFHFLWPKKKYPILYMYYIIIMYSLTDEHLDVFLLLALVNSAEINMGLQISLQHKDFISVICILSCGFAGVYGSSF